MFNFINAIAQFNELGNYKPPFFQSFMLIITPIIILASYVLVIVLLLILIKLTIGLITLVNNKNIILKREIEENKKDFE